MASAGERTKPDLSVVITVVSGARSVRRCVEVLAKSAPKDVVLEILVPIEQRRNDVLSLAAELPAATFVDVPDIAHENGARGPLAEHERYDRRRAAGLRTSRGAVVAILEDHGTPREDWISEVLRAHADLPHAAIGGVVANRSDGPIRTALWLCDFHRYAPPRPAGPAPSLTDVNVSYKRAAIMAVEPAWRERFQEPVVHEALASRGETLWLSPALAVDQERPAIPLEHAMSERLAWGRVYGRIRARRYGRARALVAGFSSLFVGPLLFWRIIRSARGRVPWGRFLVACPAIALLLFCWCLGETFGTIGRAFDRSTP